MQFSMFKNLPIESAKIVRTLWKYHHSCIKKYSSSFRSQISKYLADGIFARNVGFGFTFKLLQILDQDIVTSEWKWCVKIFQSVCETETRGTFKLYCKICWVLCETERGYYTWNLITFISPCNESEARNSICKCKCFFSFNIIMHMQSEERQCLRYCSYITFSGCSWK